MRSFLKDRFGERAANVLSVLKLWEAFGKVYAAACAAWEDDSKEYRASAPFPSFVQVSRCSRGQLTVKGKIYPLIWDIPG
eukprot:722017-Pleurochrysis_carterae.AAC.1